MDNLDKLAIYKLGKEVPDTAKKAITEGNLKGFTDINPMWRIKKLTEIFGPCGFGWYTEITNKWIEQGTGGGIAAFVELNLYVRYNDEWSKPIQGIGGSMLVNVFSKGLKNNDEAFKMAYTDAISVACKALGIGADVYYAKDRTKYDLPEQEAEESESPKEEKTEKNTAPNGKKTEDIVEYITEEQIKKLNDYLNDYYKDSYKKVLKKFNINNVVQLKRKDAQSLIDRIEAAIAIEKAKAEAAS